MVVFRLNFGNTIGMNNPVGAPNSNTPKPISTGNSIDGFARPSRPMAHPTTAAPLTNSGAITNANLPPQEVIPTEKVEKLMPENAFSNNNNKTSKLWTVILIVLVIVIFVGGLYGVYKYQQNKIDSANAKVKVLTTENEALKNEISRNSSMMSNSTISTTTTFKFPEQGFSLKLPTELADITYVENSTKTGANISTQALTAADPACTSSATVAPLGTIEKVTGQFPTATSTTTTLIKQYSTYYIAYIKPASNCSASTQVNNLANSLINNLKSTFTSIEIIT
jgi:cell division protein FtsL